MKCVLNGKNAGILAKAIHSFARIGCELYLEADGKSGLSLRTVNMTKSAFSSILFNLDFFSSFIIKSKTTDENQCKLSMKSCLGVFRNMKQVESCTISLDTKSFKLIVQFKCRLETLRTHHISILEQETLQAAYFTDRSLNVIGGDHKIFANIVTNFKANEEELSIKASDKDIVVQNYADGTHVDNRFVRTQITLKPEEFECYKIGECTTITFCMRELRAILGFAESMNASITANFDTAGRPVVFVIKDFETFEANLVMSTLSPEDTENECQQSRSLVHIHSQTTDNISLDKTHATVGDKKSSQPNDVWNTSKKRNISCSNVSDLMLGTSKNPSLDVLRTKKPRISTEHRRDTCLPPVNDIEMREHTNNSPPPRIDLESENIVVEFQDDSPDPNTFNSSTDISIPPNVNDNRDHRPFVRHIFNRCFTGNTAPSLQLGEILAEASDDEQ